MVSKLDQDTHLHNRRLEALYHLAVELTALRDKQLVLDTALQHCLELTESQFGFVGLNTDEGTAMEVEAIQGFHPSARFHGDFRRIPLRPNIFARVVLENRPVRSEDAMTDPTRVGQPAGHPPVRTFLGVPLLFNQKPVGMIGVANRPRPYGVDHEQLLVTYAAQVSIVIRNAQLYEALSASREELARQVSQRTQELEQAKEELSLKAVELAKLLKETVDIQERERLRISQDMHDGINQLIIGGLLELKSGRERLRQGKKTEAEKSIKEVQNILHRVDTELRRIVHDLRPPTLDSLGLAPALRIYIERFEKYAGIPCDFLCDGVPVRLSPDTEIGIYRLVQEALQNVSAHSQAKKARIDLVFEPGRLALTVSDTGKGFDIHQVFETGSRHYGLASMRERCESLGGELDIETAPGKGTRVHLSVPISESASAGKAPI